VFSDCQYTLTFKVYRVIIYIANERGDEYMSIASDIIREHTDTIILSALLLRDSYGYEINKKIKSASGGRYELNEATLYTAFRMLDIEF